MILSFAENFHVGIGRLLSSFSKLLMGLTVSNKYYISYLGHCEITSGCVLKAVITVTVGDRPAVSGGY